MAHFTTYSFSYEVSFQALTCFCPMMFFCFFQICVIESLVSLGTSLLVLVVMPHFDILTNLFISGGVCIVSAVLQIVYRLQRESWKILFPICSLLLTSAGNTPDFTVASLFITETEKNYRSSCYAAELEPLGQTPY